MQKFIDWLETSFAPKMEKVNSNMLLQALKDSMLQMLPLILVGSLITILAIVFPRLWSVQSYTMGLLGIICAFLIPFNYMERRRLRNLRLIAGMTGFAMFAIIVQLDNPEFFTFASLGAGGMFASLIVGIVAAFVFTLFGSFSFFKADSSMPDFVRGWFDNMIPVTLLLVGTWALVHLAGLDIFNLILLAFSPLTHFSENVVGFTLIYFAMCFFYSMGISVWLISSLTNPIRIAAIMANSALVAQGLAATNLFTTETIFLGWIAIGGTGGTLILVVLMLFSKSKRLKSLGKASLVPSFLNINEPIIFGAVAWNPIMMIPLWIHGLVTPVITYYGLKAGLAAIPSQVLGGLWYMPYPLSTWMVSPSVGAMVLLAILVGVNGVIYYPFLKVYEKQQLKLEAEEAK